ncbi:MAG TPA: VOC family protein [Thermoplasmata archaeon]|nr:VOC family protein [Thermoplasmata archaeon]
MATARRTDHGFYGVRLLANDFRKTWHFYRDRIGLIPAKGHGEPPYGEFVWRGRPLLAIYDRKLMARAVGLASRRASRKSVGGAVVILEVEDVDREAARLKRQGVRLFRGPTDRPAWGLRTIHFLDPDNQLVEVFSRLRHQDS